MIVNFCGKVVAEGETSHWDLLAPPFAQSAPYSRIYDKGLVKQENFVLCWRLLIER